MGGARIHPEGLLAAGRPHDSVMEFVGRRAELGEVRRLLGSARVVTVTGMGGAGKTRLARQVAEESRRSFADGVWLAELADGLDPASVDQAVAVAVGLHLQPDTTPRAVLTQYLAERESLLVLDNCEHVIAACASLVGHLVRQCPRLTVLATSREVLGVGAEVVYPVPPLARPELDGAVTAASIGHLESVVLFVNRAAAALPSFELTDANAGAIARLCVALEGMPLAIELAAARVRVLSPQQILDRLDDRFRLLSRGYADAPARQQSLRASIEWSYDLCTPAEQALWDRLSVFHGGFELDAAEYVAGPDLHDQADVLDLLESLVEKSVVTPVTTQAESDLRFRLLEPLRQFGAEQLELGGKTGDVRRRHLDHYVELAHRFDREWIGPDQPAWLARLRRDHDNLRAALDHALTEPATVPAALRVTYALRPFWTVAGLDAAATATFVRGLEQASSLAPADHYRALVGIAQLAALQGDSVVARSALDRASFQQDAVEPALRNWAQLAEAMLALFAGRFEQATESLAEVTEWMLRADDLQGALRAMLLHAAFLRLTGSVEEAHVLMQRVADLAEEQGDLVNLAPAKLTLAQDARDAGDRELMTALFAETTVLLTQTEDLPVIGLTLDVAVVLAADAQLWRRARVLMGCAEQVFDRAGQGPRDVMGLSLGLSEIRARVAAELGETESRTAYAEGRHLSIAGALAYARGAESTSDPVTDPGEGPDLGLTPRELEVAGLLAAGLSNREIAAQLVISVRTAQGHVEHILRKLGFSSRTQVAAWLTRRGTGGAQPSSDRTALLLPRHDQRL